MRNALRGLKVSPTLITSMKPYLSHFYTIVLALLKKTVVNKWKITLCNSSTALVSEHFDLTHVQQRFPI